MQRRVQHLKAKTPTRPLPLRGLRVLVADNEALVALDLEATLSDAGALPVGPFLHLDQALKGAGLPGTDAAILDTSLGCKDRYALADALQKRGVALIFHSGHTDPASLLRRYPKAGYCPKPCGPDLIIESVVGVIGDRMNPRGRAAPGVPLTQAAS